jgi:hypothetical protein
MGIDLLQQIADPPLQEIEQLIFQLEQRREEVAGESERVQQELMGYAKLTQETMQSTKVISESLAQWKKEQAVDEESPAQEEQPRAVED